MRNEDYLIPNSSFLIPKLDDSDHLNLYQGILRESLDSNSRTGGESTLKLRGIHFVHSRKITHISQKDRGLHHIVHRQTSLSQDCLHVS